MGAASDTPGCCFSDRAVRRCWKNSTIARENSHSLKAKVWTFHFMFPPLMCDSLSCLAYRVDVSVHCATTKTVVMPCSPKASQCTHIPEQRVMPSGLAIHCSTPSSSLRTLGIVSRCGVAAADFGFLPRSSAAENTESSSPNPVGSRLLFASFYEIGVAVQSLRVLRAGLLQDARLRHRRQADGFAEHLVGFRVSLGFYDGSCKGPVPAVRHVLGHVWGSQCSGAYGHWRRQQQQQCLQRTVIIIIMIMGSVSSQASQFASSLPLSSSATLLVIMTTVART